MDEQSFRRLAPDAVAGRLDDATYTRWRAFAKGDPEREAFVVRVTAAHERISGRTEVVRETPAREPVKRVPKRVFWMLAPFFALFGALGGGLAMHSFLQNRDAMAQPADNRPAEHIAADRADKPDDNTASEPAPENELEPEVEPEAEVDPETEAEVDPETEADVRTLPEPEPEGEAPPRPAGLALTAGEAKYRPGGKSTWRNLDISTALKPGDRVAVLEGEAKFASKGLTMHGTGRIEFEVMRGGTIWFVEGELAVRADGVRYFKTQKNSWRVHDGAFVVKPGRFGGELWLAEGFAEVAYRNNSAGIEAPAHVQLDSSLKRRPMTRDETLTCERKLIGPHDVLLHWDAETPATTPELGEVFSPGPFGKGHAMRRALGRLEIGATPGAKLFTGAEGARLRMRVRTDAPQVRLSMRVQLDDGYRAVDANVPVSAGEGWLVVDVPLSILRAGHGRDEPGWIPSQPYSAFTISPAVDPDRPLLRRELAVDDVLVYVPR